MKIAVLGTGVVGRTLATKCVDLGYSVTVGSRSPDSDAAAEAARDTGAAVVTVDEAASAGDIVINALPGSVCLSVLEGVADVVADKVLVDVANPLDFSQGFPPSLSVVNTDSLGEQIQRALPRAKVVKALNTLNASLMVQPGLLPAASDLFIAGDDADAKAHVVTLLTNFGWQPSRIHDLGGITAARGTEMYLPLWLQLMGSVGSATFNISVVSAPGDEPTG